MKTVSVNGELIRRRRLAGGPGSLRELARQTHLTNVGLSRMEANNNIGGATSLAQLSRLADCLGVTLADLLTPSEQAPAMPSNDVTALGTLLAHDPRLTDRTAICRSLGWTLERLSAAEELLDANLRPLGQRLHRLNGAICLRPATAALDAAAAQVAAERAADHSVNITQASLLLRASRGVLRSNTLREGDLPHLATLLSLGVLERSADGGRHDLRLTAEASSAFLLDDVTS
jgi:transcriptional regulator with XRE-family HTH domain